MEARTTSGTKHSNGGALHCTTHEKIQGFRLSCVGRPGNSSVAYLVMQNRDLEYGEPRCGFDTKHQSTSSTCRAVLECLVQEVDCLMLRGFSPPPNSASPCPGTECISGGGAQRVLLNLARWGSSVDAVASCVKPWSRRVGEMLPQRFTGPAGFCARAVPTPERIRTTEA